MAEQFRLAMESERRASATRRMFINLADEPGMERMLDAAHALTAAEYLAFVEGRHVLVILTDMTNYCEALREVSASPGDPGPQGLPRLPVLRPRGAVRARGVHPGRAGTITQMPILTMPDDDTAHPIPDLTGYITEGQIVLDQLNRRGIYPPVRVLPSLSRLMDAGTGEGFTDPDHPALAHQLFAAYALRSRMRVLASVMGEQGLPEIGPPFPRVRQAVRRAVRAPGRLHGRSRRACWPVGRCCRACPRGD